MSHTDGTHERSANQAEPSNGQNTNSEHTQTWNAYVVTTRLYYFCLIGCGWIEEFLLLDFEDERFWRLVVHTDSARIVS